MNKVGRAAGGIAARLGLVGDRVHSVFVQFPLPEAERKKSIPKSSIQGKACARCSPAPLHGKKRERKEGIGHGGEGPMRRHRREQAALGRKSEESKQTNPRGKRSGRSYQNPVWSRERSHTPVTNPCPPWAVMCEPYFGKLRQGQPGEAVPAPGESPKAPGAVTERVRASGAEPGGRTTQNKIQPHPQTCPAFIPATPSPTQAGNGR